MKYKLHEANTSVSSSRKRFELLKSSWRHNFTCEII